MNIDRQTALVILGMALVTYVTRATGFWLMGHLRLTPRVGAWLRAVPGAVLVSLVSPAVLATGPAELAASVATVAVAARSRNLLAAMVSGVAVVWVLRTAAHLR